MDWLTYEETVRDIYETLGKNYGVSIEGFGNICKVIGKSGVQHQIDVLTSHTDGIHKYLTAIECKYWNEKVDKVPVMKLIEIINDCNFNKGVLVSKIGFTPDAIKFAKYSNVSLVELREHNIIGNLDNVTKIFFNIEITQAKLDFVNCIVDKEHFHDYKLNPPEGAYSDYYVQQASGAVDKVGDLVLKFLNNNVLQQELFIAIEETISFPIGSFLKSNVNNYSFPLKGITCRGFIIKFTKIDFDYIENKVSLIMKNLFEKKDYTVTSTGEIANLILPPLKISVGEKVKMELRLIRKKFDK